MLATPVSRGDSHENHVSMMEAFRSACAPMFVPRDDRCQIGRCTPYTRPDRLLTCSDESAFGVGPRSHSQFFEVQMFVVLHGILEIMNTWSVAAPHLAYLTAASGPQARSSHLHLELIEVNATVGHPFQMCHDNFESSRYHSKTS